MDGLGLSFDCPDGVIERLMTRYGEPHRHYHTWSHVLACLHARAELTSAAWPEVDLALLFHDAVYDPMAMDNEERSAELLLEEGRRAWLDENLLQRARPLVLATKHHAGPLSLEASIVVDADLSILGAQDATFDLYEQQIRAEYARVDEKAYVAGRRRVLESFALRPHIYTTTRAQGLWEQCARKNIARSLAMLP